MATKKRTTEVVQGAARTKRLVQKSDPLYNRTVEKALAILEAFGDRGRALNLGAAILGEDGRPIAAVNISGPTSRWTLPDLRNKLSSLLLETAHAASSGLAGRRKG